MLPLTVQFAPGSAQDRSTASQNSRSIPPSFGGCSGYSEPHPADSQGTGLVNLLVWQVVSGEMLPTESAPFSFGF